MRQYLESKGYAESSSSIGTSFNEPEKKTVTGFLGNIVKSGANLVKDTLGAISNPVETTKAITNTSLGGIAKVVPGRQAQEDQFDALVSFYKERYGSIDKLKETAYSDPVGFASDIATFAGGAGVAAKVGNFGKAAEVASTVNKFTDPLQAATAIPKALTPTGFVSKTAERLYQSALKPSTKLSDVQRAELITTGLREGIPVTSAGLDELGKSLNEVNRSISEVIKQASKQGDVVSTAEISKRLNDVRERVGNTINGRMRLKDIDEIEQNFLSQYGDTIPVEKAQQVKVNTYQVLRKSYGEMKSVAIEGEKALARGIKEELATKYTQLKALNARDSALINLERALEKAVGRISNRDVVGLGTTVASTANPFAGLLKAVIDNPTVKSKLAIALQKAGSRKPKAPGVVKRSITPATRLSKPARESNQESAEPQF